MKIVFLSDFGGRETRDIRYVKGQVVSFERELAELLVRDGRAVFLNETPEPEQPEPQEEPALAPAKRTKRKRGKA